MMMDKQPGKTLRVLIADDAPEARRTTQLMLADNPLVKIVALCDDGKEAIRLAREHQPDIAILDINMPEVDGFTACEEMQHENPRIACLIISTETGKESFRTAMRVGAREYLTKPFTFDELNNAVTRVGKVVNETLEEELYPGGLHQQRRAYLVNLASEFSRDRRTDDQALAVYEQLANDPGCEARWLRTLAMIYVIRKEWIKLQSLAGRLAKLERPR